MTTGNFEVREAATACGVVLAALRADRGIPATLSDYRTIEGAMTILSRIADDMFAAEVAAKLADAAKPCGRSHPTGPCVLDRDGHGYHRNASGAQWPRHTDGAK